MIAAADQLFDFGPGAGDHGGEITAFGPPKKVAKSKASLTGEYLAGRRVIFIPTNRRIPPNSFTGEPTADVIRTLAPAEAVLSLIGARQHNLRNVDVHFPLGAFIAVTGVSGSGKSSLINEVLYNTLARKLHRARTVAAAHDEVRGLEHVDKIIRVDQDPIGNAPSSNPATYTGVFDLIRELFARLPESKVRGYHPRRFSFNQKGGRCEACEGNGQKKIEMHFLPDVWVECEVCHGERYNPETLAVRYKDKSIADVLELRIEEARTVRQHPESPCHLADARRCRSRVYDPRSTGPDHVRRRGPASQTRGRTCPAIDWPDVVLVGRADDRAALRRRTKAPRRAAPTRRLGEYGDRRRAQP